MFDLVLGHTCFLGNTGYAIHAREFFTALSRLVNVGVKSLTSANIEQLSTRQKSLLDVGLLYQQEIDLVNIVLMDTNNPAFYAEYTGPKIAYNVWESTKQPKEFFDRLLTYDRLWVPSEWQAQCTIAQGYPKDKLIIIPEGVNTELFVPNVWDGRTNREEFVFLVVGKWEYRKATTEIIRAFLQEFASEPNIKLMLMVDNPFDTSGLSTEDKLKEFEFGKNKLIIKHFVPQEEYIRLLHNCHVLVSCSRSEGWNLPLIEAMACGTPVICSDYGAQLDYTKEHGNLVNIIGHEKPQDLHVAGNPVVDGTWASPDFGHLRKVMRNVYEDYVNKLIQAAMGAKHVATQFSWNRAAERAVESLEELHRYTTAKKRLLTTCRVFDIPKNNHVNKTQGLFDLCDRYINKDTVMCELGSFAGVSSEVFALHCKILHCVDRWEPYGEVESTKLLTEAEAKFDVLESGYPNIIKHKSTSSAAVDMFADGELDVVYIDAEHEYNAVKSDIAKWLPKVKSGGVICGHDYTTAPGVFRAVNEKFIRYTIHTFSDDSWAVELSESPRTAKHVPSGEVILFGAYVDTPEKETILRESFARAKGVGLPIAIVSHLPLKPELSELFDYVFYEKENIVSHGWDLQWWHETPGVVRLEGKYGNGTYQPVAIMSSWNIAISALSSRFSVIHYIESDTRINWLGYLNKAREKLKTHKLVGFSYDGAEKQFPCITTNILSFDSLWARDNFPLPNSWAEYLDVNDKLMRAGITNGNCIFEVWFPSYLTMQGLDECVSRLSLQEKATIVEASNLIKRGIKNNLRVDLCSTIDDKVLLFMLNTNDDTKETFVCEIKQKDRSVHKFIAELNVLNYIELPHIDSVYEVYVNNTLYKTIEIKADEDYVDMKFKFADDRYVCSPKLPKDELTVVSSFIDGLRVTLTGNSSEEFFVECIDKDTGKLVHSDKLKTGTWTSPFRKYYTNWQIKVKNSQGKVVYNYDFDLSGKRVLISLASKSLGDTLAWLPYVEVFAKKYSAKVVVSSWWQELYKTAYPDIEFVQPGQAVHDLYASYSVGCFDSDVWKNKNDWRTIPLQKVACDFLGLEYVEIRPKLGVVDTGNDVKGDYVCISEHATMQAKYWNYPNGWQTLVDSITSIGYKVVVVSKEPTTLINVQRRINKPIEETINTIRHAKAFIGLGSGLSWVAWALNIPVVMISGFSKPWCEFSTGIERMFNPGVCNGCFNDPEFPFDRGDWNWCPREENFVCTRSIPPEMVLAGLKSLLNN